MSSIVELDVNQNQNESKNINEDEENEDRKSVGENEEEITSNDPSSNHNSVHQSPTLDPEQGSEPSKEGEEKLNEEFKEEKKEEGEEEDEKKSEGEEESNGITREKRSHSFTEVLLNLTNSMEKGSIPIEGREHSSRGDFPPPPHPTLRDPKTVNDLAEMVKVEFPLLNRSSSGSNLRKIPSGSNVRGMLKSSSGVPDPSKKRNKVSALVSLLYPCPFAIADADLSDRRRSHVFVKSGSDVGLVKDSIVELPREILFQIFSFLELKDIQNCSLVHSTFRYISDDWKIVMSGKPKGDLLSWVTEERREKQRILLIAVGTFNTGETKMALEDVVNANIISNQPCSIAYFLKGPEPLSKLSLKKKIEFLFNKEHLNILVEYVSSYNYYKLDVTDALRKLFSGIDSVPDTKLAVLMEKFGQSYYRQNGLSSNVFLSPHSVSNLAFQVCLLVYLEDLSKRATIPPMKKFIENSRGINEGRDFPITFLESIYERTVHLGLDHLALESIVGHGNPNEISYRVVKTGWMVKTNGSEFLKMKKRRWFMLINKSLFYYRKPGDANPEGRITLCDVFVDKLQKTKKANNAFKMEWPQMFPGHDQKSQKHNLTYYFVTDSEEECDSWIQVLNENIFYTNADFSPFHFRQHLQQTQQHGVLHAVSSGIHAMSSALTSLVPVPSKSGEEKRGKHKKTPSSVSIESLESHTTSPDSSFLSINSTNSNPSSPVLQNHSSVNHQNNNNYHNNNHASSNNNAIPVEKGGQVISRRNTVSKRSLAPLLYGIKVEPLPYFGVPLEMIVQREGREIPALLEFAIKYITDKALREEGILRVSGSLAEINELRAQVEKEGIINFAGHDSHTVTGILKCFLRELPEPIIPPEINSGIVAMMNYGEGQEVMEEMKSIFETLSPASMAVLKAIIDFLILVTRNQDANKMTINNLMIVFTPTLKIAPGVISIPMNNYDFFFPPKSVSPSASSSNNNNDPTAPLDSPRSQETKIDVSHFRGKNKKAQRNFIGNRRPNSMKTRPKSAVANPVEESPSSENGEKTEDTNDTNGENNGEHSEEEQLYDEEGVVFQIDSDEEEWEAEEEAKEIVSDNQ